MRAIFHSFLIVWAVAATAAAGAGTASSKAPSPPAFVCDGGLKIDLMAFADKLARVHDAACKSVTASPCAKGDPTVPCAFTSKVWAKISPELPSTAQCAAFDLSGDICGSKWQAEFSCVCKDRGKDINPQYAFNCARDSVSVNCQARGHRMIPIGRYDLIDQVTHGQQGK